MSAESIYGKSPEDMALEFVRIMNARHGANSAWDFGEMLQQERRLYDLSLHILWKHLGGTDPKVGNAADGR